MATSPPGSWPDPILMDAKPAPLNIRRRKPPGDHSEDKGKQKSNGAWNRNAKRAGILPPEIMEQILYLTDPETFASLVLVSHAWRAASQTPHLYAYHLSRCPSFSISNNVITGPFTDNSLAQLKRQFVQEVKRNLFVAYLRPRQTVMSFISSTTSASAPFPGGEAFDFCFSPNGHWVLALSSSRIYVIDAVSPKISVQRELKVLRRPISAAILDDGSTLAVLASDHRVNIYSLKNIKLKHLQSVSLDNQPHNIALSPKGEVLAAAYDGGIELHSLVSSANSTDRRSVKCDHVDSLAFSSDGTMLLGTTLSNKIPSTVVLSAPFYDEGSQELPPSDMVSQMWTSQILFPTSSRDCSHASLLPHHSEGDASWTCTYDRVFESFRAVRTDDLRNGTTYFTGPKRRRHARSRRTRQKLTPCTLPTPSHRGELIAAGFQRKDVWIYGVPESLDSAAIPQSDDQNSQSNPSTRQNSSSSSASRSPAIAHTRGESSELSKLPQWQVLVDKHRNVLVKGRKIAEASGVTAVKWVERQDEKKLSRSVAERLVIAAPGGVSGPEDLEEEDFASVDGGRLILLDFDRGLGDGKVEKITCEVGNKTPELLEEEDMDLEAEVDLVRRRTVRQRHPYGTSVADALASAPELPTQSSIATTLSSEETPPIPQMPASLRRDIERQEPASPVEGLSLEEASQVFDGPYSHTNPRSRTSLYRSATAVAANRQRNPPRIPTASSGHVQYRRPGDRTELPHESDADNWVPPPPVYTAKPDRPLPEYLRQMLIPKQTDLTRRRSRSAERPRRASTMSDSPVSALSSRRIISDPERLFGIPHRSDTLSTIHTVSTMHEGSRLPRRSDTFSTMHDSPNVPRRTETISTLGDIREAPLASDVQPQPTEPASPISSVGFSFRSEPNDVTPTSQTTSPATPSRRPVSAFVGRFRPSHQRSLTARLTSPISPIPLNDSPRRRQSARSTSLPSSPIRVTFSSTQPRASSRLTLSGANLQSRLEYPLPPPPPNGDMTPVQESPARPSTMHDAALSNAASRAALAHDIALPSLPTAQQLVNLHNRYCQPPTPPSGSGRGRPTLPTLTTTPSGSRTSTTPRAAVGGAGEANSTASPVTERRRLSIIHRNSFAVSSPTLLRPPPHRLDTIQSVSSQTRPQSREAGREGGSRAERRRSRSAGPVTRQEGRRKWFVGKKARKAREQQAQYAAGMGGGLGAAGGSAYQENARMLSEHYGMLDAGDEERGGKCIVM
ncbi:MAG: hypothetical protein Q9214_004262 [Letrouitia sp. 1 TL-2023]